MEDEVMRYFGENNDGERIEIPIVPCLVCLEATGEHLPEPPCQSTMCPVCGTYHVLHLCKTEGRDADISVSWVEEPVKDWKTR